MGGLVSLAVLGAVRIASKARRSEAGVKYVVCELDPWMSKMRSVGGMCCSASVVTTEPREATFKRRETSPGVQTNGSPGTVGTEYLPESLTATGPATVIATVSSKSGNISPTTSGAVSISPPRNPGRASSASRSDMRAKAAQRHSPRCGHISVDIP